MFIEHLYLFFGEILIHLVYHFNWIVFSFLSFKTSLYILDASHITDVNLVALHFTLLMMSFELQKDLIFIKSSLSIFYFICILLMLCLRN